jgi:hypothetical protein
MNPKEFEAKKQKDEPKVEEQAKSGNIEKLAKFLHDMPKEERLSIENDIHNKSQSNSSDYPLAMKFSNDGKTGDLKSIDVENRNGIKEHYQFDQASGNLKSFGLKEKDGTTSQIERDPKTGNEKSFDEKNPDGTTIHVKDDPASGKEISQITKFGDNSGTIYIKTDPKTGKETYTDSKYRNAKSGIVTSEEIDHHDGRYESKSWDPQTGKLVSRGNTNKDGSGQAEFWDSQTGNLTERDKTDKHGVKHEEQWDAKTGKPIPQSQLRHDKDSSDNPDMWDDPGKDKK